LPCCLAQLALCFVGRSVFREMVARRPESHRLVHVADWYMQRLAPAQRQQMKQAVAAACKDKRPLRVGSMCSGTDSPIVVLKALEKALQGQLVIEHTFSCEYDKKKRAWIKDNFPGLKILFGDVNELKDGIATNHLTTELVSVPHVDIVIAGFVCKSVSQENNERGNFSNCINDASGKTGETFDGVMGYVKKFGPSIVICENVLGLMKKNKGKEPVIQHVKASFMAAGYAFDHSLLDTRSYLLPQRRNRCWMWAFKGLENQKAVELTTESVLALSSTEGFSLDEIFRMADVIEPPRKAPLPRQQLVVNNALRKVAKAALKRKRLPGQDIVVDVAKSESRCPFCEDATPCIVPNSLPFRVTRGHVLNEEMVHCVQGIYKEDFPALAKWAKEKKSLTRDLAGNAFSTTVCMAVAISCLACGPLPGDETSGSCSSPVRRSRSAPTEEFETPPRRKRRSALIEEVETPRPLKRLRRLTSLEMVTTSDKFCRKGGIVVD